MKQSGGRYADNSLVVGCSTRRHRFIDGDARNLILATGVVREGVCSLVSRKACLFEISWYVVICEGLIKCPSVC